VGFEPTTSAESVSSTGILARSGISSSRQSGVGIPGEIDSGARRHPLLGPGTGLARLRPHASNARGTRSVPTRVVSAEIIPIKLSRECGEN